VRYLLDESAVIDFLEGRASTAGWLLSVSPRDVGLPAPCLARLVERGHLEASETRRAQLAAIVGELVVVSFGRAEAEKAGELSAWAQQHARALDLIDICCAATSVVHGATLVTVRPGVFVDLPDLKVDVR
jgi:predicted nucleic acid-binding protein